MSDIQTRFVRDGYVIERQDDIRSKVSEINSIFGLKYCSRFSLDYEANRNLIKRFADSIELADLFATKQLIELVRHLGCATPVYCGPVVSHYTHTDVTGNSYGLPWHQDFPSMASSSRSVIVWISVNDCSLQTHSIEVVPGRHVNGLLQGSQRDNGYVLTQQVFENSCVLEIDAGDILIFSPYLPHRTFVNPSSADYKLSFSRRFDDLDDTEWSRNKFANAYGTVVNRNLYKSIKHY